MNIPQSHQDLLRDDVRSFISLATLMEDGAPQVTPVWFSFDGTHIVINSVKGRLKDRNMRRRPVVGLVIIDPTNPYRYIQVRGKVEKVEIEGARDHINFLSMKYQGEPVYQGPADQVRVMYFIATDHVSVYG